MTDTTLTPEAGPEAPPDVTAQPPVEPEPAAAAPAPADGVEHTPGGWPVVPLAVTGTNTTASLLATASLVGGPVALAVAATGAVVLGTAAASRKARQQRRPGTGTRRSTRTGMRAAAGPGSAGRLVPQSRKGNAGSVKAAGHGGRAGGRPGPRSTAAHRAATPSTLRKPLSSQGGKSGAARAAGPSTAPGGKAHGGRVGRVKALRDAARSSVPSRAVERAQTTAARRQVADARRDAKQQARTTRAAKKGPIGRAVARGLNKAGAMRRAAVERARAARDRQNGGMVDWQRAAVRKAPARKRARKALRRAAARFQGRRLLAALLGAALGLVGMVTTRLGRKLGWAWLQHPGRRLYARLMRAAQDERTARDDAIRDALQEEEAAADAEAADDGEEIGDTVERPAGLVPATPTTTASEGEEMSGFRFEDHAAEMEAAASSYEPDDCMEILAMIEGLPAALTSVANVMKILAERSDSEFPLEKEVAGSFNDAFGAVMAAVAVAEDMAPLFRQVHAQDIARHEDPRNGTQAEKGWNV
ncbi:hypothetical protein ABZ508_16635 [Streptomyces lavendulocolor]|uniref:Uncharacterized protein n=1 Tax=Streptomyces lavendulocolor TaxID=67316 RepID=A0ABV2W615_9ACTN